MGPKDNHTLRQAYIQVHMVAHLPPLPSRVNACAYACVYVCAFLFFEKLRAYTVCNSHVCRTLREPLLIPQRRRRGGQVFRGSGLKGKCRQLQGTTRLRGTSSSTQRSQFTNEYMTPS